MTTVAATLIDLAPSLDDLDLERAISDADIANLTTPDRLLSVLEQTAPRPGTGRLRTVLTKHTFTITDSELEQRFIPIALEAGLTMPKTRQIVNGHRVDFHWPDLGLVVETDKITYHRTPAQQAADRLRDQTHAAAGMTAVRFTRAQVYRDPGHVLTILRAIARRLAT